MGHQYQAKSVVNLVCAGTCDPIMLTPKLFGLSSKQIGNSLILYFLLAVGHNTSSYP